MSAAVRTAPPPCSHLDDQINASIEVIEEDAASELIEQLDDCDCVAFENARDWLWTEHRMTPRQVQACEREPLLDQWIEHLRDTDHQLWRDQVDRSTAAIVDGCRQ